MNWTMIDEQEARSQGWNLCTVISDRKQIIKGRPLHKVTYRIIRLDLSPFPSDDAARQFVMQTAAGRPNSVAQKAITLAFQSEVSG